ncbi:MAG: aKG-HExxH-type peptide beta-hydroxylase [Terriglobia bacterium]
MRLAQQVIQESLFLVPGLPCDWLEQTGRQHWSVRCDLSQNFERMELAGCVSLGVAGAYLEPPGPVKRELAKRDFKAALLIREKDIRLRVGRLTTNLLNAGNRLRWGWRHVWPVFLKAPNPVWPAGLTLGPTLGYSRKDRVPILVAPTSAGLSERIRKALAMVEDAWPDGARNLALLSQRMVPLKAHGVVSFSYRHRPGLSFINTFERDGFDLIDDLVHENSHHHLNLLLRKYVMQRHDRNQEIFYSPWRRSLRPLRGILHATFTFTMGAILFERLSSLAARRDATLTARQVLRTRFRCLEEVASVEYSLRDLDYAGKQLGWLTASGMALVRQLKQELAKVKHRIAPYEATVLRSCYGRELRRHRKELAIARKTYVPS